MTNDKFISYYIDLIHKEQRRLRDGLMESSTISMEELRRTQGIHEGLSQALDMLKDSIEANNV